MEIIYKKRLLIGAMFLLTCALGSPQQCHATFSYKLYCLKQKFAFVGHIEAKMFKAVKTNDLGLLKKAHTKKEAWYFNSTERELQHRFTYMYDKNGESLLTYAAKNGDSGALIEYLLNDMGISPFYQGKKDTTLLHEMLNVAEVAENEEKYEKALQYILEHQLVKIGNHEYSDIHVKKDGKYPLDIALERGLDKLALVILKAVPNAEFTIKKDKKYPNKKYPLDIAFENGLEELAICILKTTKANKIIFSPKNKGSTLLHYAVEKKLPSVIKYLTTNKLVDITKKDANGNIALYYATINQFYECFSDLNDTGATTLHFAASIQDFDLFKKLLRSGYDPDTRNKAGKTALDLWKKEYFEGHSTTIELERLIRIQKGVKTCKAFTKKRKEIGSNKIVQDPITKNQYYQLANLDTQAKKDVSGFKKPLFHDIKITFKSTEPFPPRDNH